MLNKVGHMLFRLSRGIVAYDKAYVNERDTGIPLEHEKPKIEVELRLATSDDIDSLTSEDHGYDQTKREVAKERLAEGQLCTIAVHQGEVAAIDWIVSNQQKWDTLGAERSGAGWRSGELPEGPVVASSPFGGLSPHLLPAL